MSNTARLIGENLRRLRVEAFLSQAELARQAGVGEATIARIEIGRQLPHAKTVRKLASALGAEPKALVPSPASLKASPESSGHDSQLAHFASLPNSHSIDIQDPFGTAKEDAGGLLRAAETKAVYRSAKD